MTAFSLVLPLDDASERTPSERILLDLVEAARRLRLLSNAVRLLYEDTIGPNPSMPSHPGRKAAPIYLEMVSECASHLGALLAEGRLSWAFDSADLFVLARAARLRSLEDLFLDDIEACDLGGGRPDIDEKARRAAGRLCGGLTPPTSMGPAPWLG